MKKYFYLVLLSMIFVSVLLVVLPKSPSNTSIIKPSPTTSPTITPSQIITNAKYFYQYGCPQGSNRTVEISSGDGLNNPYFQESCFNKNNQLWIHVQNISFYEKYKDNSNISILNYQESNLDVFKTISFTINNDNDYFELFLTSGKVISLRGHDHNFFNQIKNSFKIVNFPTPTPKLIPDVSLLDTQNWQSQTCQNLSFLSPPKYTVKCNPNSDVVISNGQKRAVIMAKKYNGGSRKEYWIDQLNLSAADVTKLTRIEENKFGDVSALDFFIDGKESPILINSGDIIIIILGGRSFDSQTGIVTRWDITDTIASTIKLNE